MVMRPRLVALLAPNPAFSELLCDAIDDDGRYRTARFSSIAALASFMTLAPVDVVVLDAGPSGMPAVAAARRLRRHGRRAGLTFETVALARILPFRDDQFTDDGIDVVLQKPVTPGQLLDCFDGLAGSGLVPRQQPEAVPSAALVQRLAAESAGKVILLRDRLRAAS